MNLPPNSASTPPIAVNEINALPGVISHFQTDRNFTKNYASDANAEVLGDLSSICLNFATTLSEAGGFGAVNRVAAYGASSKFLLFGLNSKRAESPGPRIFGICATGGSDESKLVNEVNQIIS